MKYLYSFLGTGFRLLENIFLINVNIDNECVLLDYSATPIFNHF